MAWIKVYFLYVPSQRGCIGSILKSAMLVMLVKSSLRCSWQQASKQVGDREEEKKVRPLACLAAQESERPTTYNVIKYRKIHRVQRRCVCRSCRFSFITHSICRNQETEGSQDRLKVLRAILRASVARATCSAPARIWLAVIDFQNGEQQKSIWVR